MSNTLKILAACGDSGFNWYGFLIGLGMVLCIIISVYNAKKRGYYGDLVFDIAICAFPLAIIGARAYYIIFDLIENPGTSWTFRKIIGLEGGLSGLAIYGGLIGACLGGLIVIAIQKRKPEAERVTYLQIADLAFCVVMLGQAIGRWGNFANQEAYGNLVTNSSWQWFPYAVFIDAENAWYQATFFYESMWDLVGAILLIWMYSGKRKSFDGFILSGYCIFYGIGRFFIEGLRADSLWLVPGVVRVSQLLSAIFVLFGIIFILVHVYKAREAGKKIFIMVKEDDLTLDYYNYEKSMLYRRQFVTPKVKENGPQFDEENWDDEDKDEYFDAEQAEKYYSKLETKDADADGFSDDKPVENSTDDTDKNNGDDNNE